MQYHSFGRQSPRTEKISTMDALAAAPGVPQRSIYDGFEGYRTPTLAEYHRALEEGMVVLDANVLLNLYRYTDRARDDLLSVMSRLDERLWIPHQVLTEFWRNRDSVLRDPRETERIGREMSGQREKALVAFRAWANRVSLPADRATRLAEQLGEGFDAVLAEVEGFNDTSAIEAARNTENDPVLAQLESLLAGQVGEPLTDDHYQRAVEEGLRRVEERLPPGYMDKDKDDASSAGDYLVWEQILVEAEGRRCDVIFVTADVKEDWWRKEAGELRGPRLELIAELRSRANARLYMLRPTRLLELAREALEVTVQDESVQDADRVDRLLSDRETSAGRGGWNLSAIESLLDQLDEEGAVQGAIIQQAALDGGFIEREKVYEIANYDPSRQLKGFTRPINRISRILREDDLIDDAAVDLLVAVYDSESENPSEAAGFEIDSRALPIVAAAVDRRKAIGS
jgi:PIN domain-containing protein